MGSGCTASLCVHHDGFSYVFGCHPQIWLNFPFDTSQFRDFGFQQQICGVCCWGIGRAVHAHMRSFKTNAHAMTAHAMPAWLNSHEMDHLFCLVTGIRGERVGPTRLPLICCASAVACPFPSMLWSTIMLKHRSAFVLTTTRTARACCVSGNFPDSILADPI